MTEVRQPREVDMVPQELRFVPQVKSDIIIQRRNVTLAPVEAANEYQRNATNTITFNIQGHRELSQLLDTKSVYFSWQCKFRNGYPVEDVSMLIEEIIISSNGRTLERIRHAQYIQHFLRGYNMSRGAKARLGKREGFQRYEDRTVQYQRRHEVLPQAAGASGAPAVQRVTPIYGFRKADSTDTAPYVAMGNSEDTYRGDLGYTDIFDDAALADMGLKSMADNLGYQRKQTGRRAAPVGGSYGIGSVASDTFGSYSLMKFRLPASGLLNCDKMLPIGWMPITIQLRLSDTARCTDNFQNTTGQFDYMITRPRLHMNVCSVGQAYASAMQQRLRGPGITLNAKMFDTFFQIINNDKQIVIPSNKQRLSKVWVFFHQEGNETDKKKNAFRSSVTGTDQYKKIDSNDGEYALNSYQFQVGTEVSEAVGLNNPEGLGKSTSVNTGMAFLEAYLRAIGAVNGHEQSTEFWGRDLDPLKCNDWEGGDLLQTFLSKYFVCVFDGEKLLGSQIETGVDTESGKDIVVDLRWNKSNPRAAAAGGVTQHDARNTRVMVLIQYHAQIVIKENSVDLSF